MSTGLLALLDDLTALAKLVSASVDAAAGQNVRVASAIRTDFILSAKIFAITLSIVASASAGVRAASLSIAGVGILIHGAHELGWRAPEPAI